MKKQKEYKLKIKRGWFMRGFSNFLRLFKRKPQIINASGGELPQRAIYVANHAGASGPFTFELFFPKRITPWGAHEMCGNYRQRWNYLYHVFYQQKLHWNKAKAFVVATLFAIISKAVYNGVGLIGTYTDSRFLSTARKSFKVLNANSSLLIFPEDSHEGYLEPPLHFFNGFVALSRMYHKRFGIDVPVYTVYFSSKQNKIIIGEAVYVNELASQGKTDDEIAAICLGINHNLFNQYVAPFAKEKKSKGKKGKKITAPQADVAQQNDEPTAQSVQE